MRKTPNAISTPNRIIIVNINSFLKANIFFGLRHITIRWINVRSTVKE
jgi:hypothetical protein